MGPWAHQMVSPQGAQWFTEERSVLFGVDTSIHKITDGSLAT